MFSFLDFFESAHFLALAVAIIIFLITVFLVVKRWIGFYTALLFLLLALIAGLIINYQSDLRRYVSSSGASSSLTNSQAAEASFAKQMKQAMEDLKTEVETEKKNLLRVIDEVQEIFDSVDAQKQKLDDFIEEVREQFKKETSAQPPTNAVEAPEK
jgi:hypothetical protein